MSDPPPNSPLPPPPSSQPSPPPPAFQPPPGYLPAPPSNPPPGIPGQVPPILPAAIGVGGIGIMSQFSGSALWSIGLGVASIAAPFVIHSYFIVLPIIGFVYGIRAIRQGRMIGGIVGLVINVVGGLVSLFVSGLIGG